MKKSKNIPSSELIRNIIFLGSSGSGKSTTCNSIFGGKDGPFPVTNDQVSGSGALIDRVCESKRIRIFDTPGFGDGGLAEREIDTMLGSLTSIFSDTRVDSTKQVDAFVLVVKLDPRAQTLKRDLARIRELFGIEAIRSSILLLIYDGDKKGHFIEKLNKMDEVKRILKEGKGEEPNEDWFCIWDNIKPREGQEDELMRKIAKLNPYTYQCYQDSEKEARQSIESKMESYTQVEVGKIYQNSNEDQDKQIEEIKGRFEKEKKALIEARERAQTNTAKILAAVENANERTKTILDKLYGQIEKEKEEMSKRLAQSSEIKPDPYSPKLEEYLRQHREMLKRFQENVEKKVEESKDAQQPKELGTLAKEFIFANDKKESKEKVKEIIGTAAKKGAETVAKKGVEEVAKKGVQEVAKKGLILIATRACNIF